MKKFRFLFLVAVCFGCSQWHALAGELTYHPINPAFGGNPSNYSWLLQSATTQNEYTKTDPLADFETNLKKQVLSTLASRIVSAAFGGYGDPLLAGQYQIGAYNITISTAGDGITVDILDKGNGASTSVSVPYY